MQKNNLVIVVVIVLILGAAALFVLNNRSVQPQSMSEENPAGIVEEGSLEPDPELDAMITEDSEMKTFEVDGTAFAFSLKEIRVNQGDTVRIVFNNKQGFHDWVLDEFDARTNQIQEGESESVTFVADRAGTFEYYCSVANHRQMGMVGNLIVE